MHLLHKGAFVKEADEVIYENSPFTIARLLCLSISKI